MKMPLICAYRIEEGGQIENGQKVVALRKINCSLGRTN